MKRFIFFLISFLFTINANSQINSLPNSSRMFKVKNLEINTDQQDFGAVFYKEKIVFASTNANAKFISRTWDKNGLPYLDLYIADLDENMEFVKIKNFSNKVNKKYNEGPVTFSEDGNFMIYTTNKYTKDKSHDTLILELYSSRLVGEDWVDETALPFNNDKYSVGHGSLSPDGKMLFFASNMPGGFGGVDIYVSFYQKGKWSKPQNLGKRINTEGNEMFPFYHESGILFFSSDGHKGLGGLDVFLSDVSKIDYPTIPKNLGGSLNSSSDDFSFILDKEQKKGFFSSNRKSGKGNDDIYYYDMLSPIILHQTITGIAYNLTDKTKLPGVNIYLIDQNNNIVDTVETNSNGTYEFTLEDKVGEYTIIGEKDDYISDTNKITLVDTVQNYTADIELEKILDFSIHVIVRNKTNRKPIKDVVVTATSNETGIETNFLTSENGDFFINLEGKKLNDIVEYSFFFERFEFDSVLYDYSVKLDREGEFVLFIDMKKKVVTVADIIDLNPIYFDFDRYNITYQASVELDKVVEFMNENPNMVVEVKSYTDCKGKKRYNQILSEKRAESTISYIKERITDPDRIYGDGYGEINLKNNGECPPDNQPDLEEKEQLSRKTDFIIIRM